MLRLPRLGCSTLGLRSPSITNEPVRRRPRCGSPVTGCSILRTSAPQSASTAPPDVTKPYMATSITFTPVIGSRMSTPCLRVPINRSVDGFGERLQLEVLHQPRHAHLAADAGLLVA